MYNRRDDIYWVWLTTVEGIGTATFNRLLRQNNSPKDIFNAVEGGFLAGSKLDKDIFFLLRKTAKRQVLERLVDDLERSNTRVLTRNNPNFPSKLMQIHNPPPVLFVRGKEMDFNALNCISIVGTRRCSVYGKGIANSFAKYLAKNGVTVVSGLALGIDTQAHEGALDARAENATITVLANGLDRPYPASNKGLYDRILQNGCAISEYPPGVFPMPKFFPIRNRLIAGLSKGVLIVEAMKRSGTRFTVDFALDSGRDIFAIPGRISDIASEYTLELIKLGAKLVTSPEEILQEYQTDYKAEPETPKEKQDVTSSEQLILKALSQGGKTIDELFEMTLLPMSHLLQNISLLIGKDLITRSVIGILEIK